MMKVKTLKSLCQVNFDKPEGQAAEIKELHPEAGFFII
jgi:hypothetical protein